MIKAILFDMDGILFDSEQFYLDGNYAQLVDLGYTGKKEALLDGIGKTMDGLFQLYYDLLEHRVPIEEIHEYNDAYYLKHPLNCKDIMFEGVDTMTKKLYEDGYLLACCSSSPLQVIEDSLKEMGIRKYFTYVQSGEELPAPKPAPDIYLEACNALSVKKEECVVYEDSDIGIAAGKAAGMFVVAREDNRFRQTQKGADLIVKDIKELVEYVEREKQYGRSH